MCGDRITREHKHIHTKHQYLSERRMSPVASTRWCPTPEQLMILEEMYRSGIRTPNAVQIQQITAHLAFYGRIEGKNVFYWFQNHKARDRQKLRKKLAKQLHQQQHQLQLQLQQIKPKPMSSMMSQPVNNNIIDHHNPYHHHHHNHNHHRPYDHMSFACCSHPSPMCLPHQVCNIPKSLLFLFFVKRFSFIINFLCNVYDQNRLHGYNQENCVPTKTKTNKFELVICFIIY